MDQWLSLQSQPERSLKILASRAHLLGQLGHWPEAQAQLQRLTELQPLVAAHWFNLGYVFEKAGSCASAELAFVRAVELAPALDAAWFGLALARARLGFLDGAVEALAHQTRLQPWCADGWEQLVLLERQRARPDLAELALDRLRSFAPRRAMALEMQPEWSR